MAEVFLGKFLDKLFRTVRFRYVIKEIFPGVVVCDLGCGRDLFFLKKIENLIQGGFGIDKDIDDNLVDTKIKIIKTDIEKGIPLPSESIEVVTMMALLEHLTSPEKVLKEIYRLLKRGGKLILTAPTPLARPLLEILAFRLKLIDEQAIRDHKKYYWADDGRKLLEQVGFNRKNITQRYLVFGSNLFLIAEK